MADMPWRFWSLGLKEGTRLVLAALWRHVRSSDREDYLRRGGAPVFVWPSISTVCRLTKRSQSSVEDDIKALRGAGLVERAKRTIGGRLILGFLLLASPADDHPFEPDELLGGDVLVGEPPETRVVPPEDSGPATSPRPPSRRGKHPRVLGVVPPEDSGPEAREKPDVKPDVDAGATPVAVATVVLEHGDDDELNRRAPRAVAVRPRQDLPIGGGPTAAFALVDELSRLHRPEGRCFWPNDPRHLAAAAELLAVVAGEGDDRRVLEQRRLDEVLGYVRDFADLCRADPKQAEFWRPSMLSTRPAPGRSLAAWDMLVNAVNAWRTRRSADRAAAAAEAERRRQARIEAETPVPRSDPQLLERLTADFLTRTPSRLPAASISRAIPPAPLESVPRTTEDEEQLRRRGHGREAWTRRTAVDDDELALRINRALLDARRAKGEVPLTAEEAEFIRRRVRGEEEATGT